MTTTTAAVKTVAELESTSMLAAPVEAPPAPPTPMQQLFRFSERFGHLMSRVVLTVLYVVLVAPAALVLTNFGDPLRIKRYRGTSWGPWREDVESPARARRQD